MNFLGLLFLLVAHYLSGRGLLRLFRMQLPPLHAFCLSMAAGVPLLSFVPCILQLLSFSITLMSVSIGIGVFTGILCIPLLIGFKRPQFKKITLPFLYELPFVAVMFLLMAVSVWRCFYYPPIARDMLTGPELLAEFTVREGTMINSVFSVDLSTTNNYFKSPYITSLQIIYKLLVCPFGQLWLSVLFLSFTMWLYSLVRSFIHPVIAGLLMLFFIALPDPYAYSYIILYDYSNMVFFCLGFYFLYRWYQEDSRLGNFFFSVFLFGIATYIRTETLILVTMIAPLVLFLFWRKHMAAKKMALYTVIFLLGTAAFYFVCIDVFVRNFVPIPLDIKSQINPNLANVSVFFTRLRDIFTVLIFSEHGIKEYGYFIFLFFGILLTDIIVVRRFNTMAAIALYGIVVVFIGLSFIGYLLPLADLINTTKRGLFKALPLMLLYMANSGILLRLSDKVRMWETPNPSR